VRVKAVKLAIKPHTTPIGLFFAPPMPPDKTTGRTGRMQGERIVTIPPRNANRMSIAMRLSSFFNYSDMIIVRSAVSGYK
jgi:hypothetical protein